MVWLCHAAMPQALMFMHLQAVRTRVDPYPTARKPGGLPISTQEFRQQRIEALRAVRRRCGGGVTSPSPSSHPGQPRQHAVSCRTPPAADMLLSFRLADTVFLGWCFPWLSAYGQVTDACVTDIVLRSPYACDTVKLSTLWNLTTICRAIVT